jgi:2-polyprenyl-3-methyl-5-hydroxy-6-metoxy-1,4-benzoquinol methylase
MCNRCGLVWTNPRPSDAEVDRYYAREYRADYARHRQPTPRKVLRGILGADERRCALGDLLRPSSRVLDVGCGAGEFVYLLRLRGLNASGIEPGEEFADFSRRVLGVPIETATVETATVAPESLDIVTMFHVLEHAADPARVMSIVSGWLAPGGVVVVEVPNVDSSVQAPRHRFHFAHLYNFSAATLGAIGQNAGLHVLQEYESDDGGNITCAFRRDLVAPPRVTELPEAAARTAAVLKAHSTVRHYLTGTPYLRARQRLRRRLAENRLLRRFKDVGDVIAWAAGR